MNERLYIMQLQLLHDLLQVETDRQELVLAEKRYDALERNYVQIFGHYPEVKGMN